MKKFAAKDVAMPMDVQAAAQADAGVFDIQRISNHMIDAQGRLSLRVTWLGFTEHEATYELASSLLEWAPTWVYDYCKLNKDLAVELSDMYEELERQRRQ